MRFQWLRWLCSAWVAVALVGMARQAAARQEALLNVSGGQVPNDTGSDGGTKMTIEDCPQLGGQALKVVFASGDSFGDRQAKVSNWKPFVALQFEAFNPAAGNVRLVLTVKHRRTTSFATRVDMPVVLKPGKNAVKIGIDELLNVNGTAPDLSAVGKWYLACEEGRTPTVYFGNLWLVGDDSPAAAVAPAVGAGAAAGPATGFRITGMIGGQVVDLTATPQAAAGNAPAARPAGAAAQVRPRWRFGAAGPHPGRRRCRPSPSPSCSTRPRPTPSARPWRSSRPTTPGTRWSPTGRCTRTRRTLSPRSGPASRCVTTTTWASCSSRQISRGWRVKIVGYAGESDRGPYPRARQHAHRGLALELPAQPGLQGPDPGRRAARRSEPERRPARRSWSIRSTACCTSSIRRRRPAAGWQAAQASVFDLKTNKLRPDGWTSTDAAGLPIFPAAVRYDELKRGMVEHAMRVTVVKTRRAYVAPATHFASSHTDENLPRMGERIRLRQDFDISGFSPPVQAILKGLKKYGMFVADNGIDWAISVAPDPRIPVLHEELRKVKGADLKWSSRHSELGSADEDLRTLEGGQSHFRRTKIGTVPESFTGRSSARSRRPERPGTPASRLPARWPGPRASGHRSGRPKWPAVSAGGQPGLHCAGHQGAGSTAGQAGSGARQGAGRTAARCGLARFGRRTISHLVGTDGGGSLGLNPPESRRRMGDGR